MFASPLPSRKSFVSLMRNRAVTARTTLHSVRLSAWSNPNGRQLLQLIRNPARHINPVRALHVTKDAEDNKFLECADDQLARRLSACITEGERGDRKSTRLNSSHVRIS